MEGSCEGLRLKVLIRIFFWLTRGCALNNILDSCNFLRAKRTLQVKFSAHPL